MKKYVSLDKRSKKAQKAYYSERRVTWGELNPVTKSVPSGKNYNRKINRRCEELTEIPDTDLKSTLFLLPNYLVKVTSKTPLAFPR